MPFPMVHFAVSYRLFECPHKAFLLGSIAPDAVWVRENEFKTAYGKSHLAGLFSEDWHGLTDFYYSKVDLVNSEEYKLFLKGYISHIMADYLWGKYKREISSGVKTLRELLWREEEQNNFNLYRTVSWGIIVEKEINTCQLYELNDMYLPDELDSWRHQIFELLHQPKNEGHFDNQYITESVVNEFISKAVTEFNNWSKTLIR